MITWEPRRDSSLEQRLQFANLTRNGILELLEPAPGGLKAEILPVLRSLWEDQVRGVPGTLHPHFSRWYFDVLDTFGRGDIASVEAGLRSLGEVHKRIRESRQRARSNCCLFGVEIDTAPTTEDVTLAVPRIAECHEEAGSPYASR